MHRKSRTSPKLKANIAGPIIREVRLKVGKTLSDLAAELDIDFGIKLDRSAIGKIERRKRRISDVELTAIAAALGVDVERLLPDTAAEALTELRRK